MAGIATLETANRFLRITFWPFRQKRFGVPPARGQRLDRRHRLQEFLSVHVAWTVGTDYTRTEYMRPCKASRPASLSLSHNEYYRDHDPFFPRRDIVMMRWRKTAPSLL